MKKILYLSHDGILEPLGESQVLGYLKKLSQKFDLEFTLITFEKKHDLGNQKNFNRIQEVVSQAGIDWRPLPYHKNPALLATALDIAICTWTACRIVLTKKIQLVHARSYVPSITALVLKKVFKTRFLFDMRGFWADERADGGQWKKSSPIYRLAKWFEKQFLLNADAVVSLTHAAVTEMKTFPYLQNKQQAFSVIPTCADLDRFQPTGFKKDPAAPFLLGHIGSIGNWYLFDEALQFFKQLCELRPNARLLIVNRGEHERIRKSLAAAGIDEAMVELKSANHDEMAGYLSRLDASVFFIRPLYSKTASAPTKLAELLGCGIPCVVNAGVGDMQQIFVDPEIGVCVENFSADAFHTAAKKLLQLSESPTSATACRSAALRHFSSDVGTENYQLIYRQILPN